jgi:hypothetical protein
MSEGDDRLARLARQEQEGAMNYRVVLELMAAISQL